MPLIKSISGIRGTVGDDDKENLSPLNIKKFVISYCQWILLSNKNLNNLRIVTGRDGRESGPEIHKLVNENTPPSMAGGCIYLYIKLSGIEIHKKQISEICKISEVTINKCYKKLEPHVDKLIR